MKSYNKMSLNQEYISIKIITRLGGVMIVYREIKNTRQDANPTTHIIGSLMKQLSVALVACLLAILLIIPTVHADGKLNKPTITTPIKSGDNEIKGEDRFSDKNGPNIIVTVIVKNASGDTVETKTSSAGYSPKWSVKLKNSVLKGYTVTAYQEYNPKDWRFKKGELNYDDYKDKKSDETDPVTVEASVADKYEGKLSMPNIEVWLENKAANLLNPDEEKEIIDAFMAANKDVVGENGKTFETEVVKVDVLKIDTLTQKTTIRVTFSDKSKLTFETTNVTYTQITETSRVPEIDTISVVDNVITGKISGEGSFEKTKVQLILKVGDPDLPKFCDDNQCRVDKDSSDPITVDVNPDGTFSYTLTGNDTISLNQIVGVSVKDYRKLPRCRTKTVVLKTPDKVEVRDPRKLTDEDKAAIDKAIRTANTKDGESKLPDGTGDADGTPAFIEFDKDGNARIISPNDVKKIGMKTINQFS